MLKISAKSIKQKNDLKLIQRENNTTPLLKSASLNRLSKKAPLFATRVSKVANLLKLNKLNKVDRQNYSSKNLLPKVVGEIRHYPPANKEWKNSIYAYNKNSLTSTAALDKIANRTIKSYFNLTNNKKLARSYRMRNLIRRSTSKRVFASKPEIKQTSSKVNVTVYILNREGQFLLRKLYFYKKNMNINRDIYLHKMWLKKNLLAFKKTFIDKKSIRLLKKNKKLVTRRKNSNKTYIHNSLIKRYLIKNQKLSDITAQASQASPDSNINKLNKSKLSLRRKNKVFSRWNSLIRNNILKSLRKRNLIRLLKTREKKTSTAIAPYLFKGNAFENKSVINSSLLSNVKGFENYLMKKKSLKINYKIRRLNSVIKIKKNLSKFFFLKGRKKKARFKKIRLPYSNVKFKKEIKFFSFKLVSELKYIRKLFMFYFIKYMFSLLHVKIHVSSNWASRLATTSTGQASQAMNNLRYQFIKNKEKKIISRKNTKKGKNKVKQIIKIKFNNRYSHSKLKKIELLNLELLNFLKLILSDISGKKKQSLLSTIIFNKNNLNSLYKKFEKKYFLIFLGKFFKKEFLYINYYSKFLLNKLKFGKFLPGLKYLINKIYSKKVKLNIVNLKYPHLNSDIYAELIASKLKKKLGLWKVLRRSLSLAKLPFDYLPYDRLANVNVLNTLTTEKSLNVFDLSKKENFASSGKESLLKQDVLNKDNLDVVLYKLYPYSYVSAVQKDETIANDNELFHSVKAPRDDNILVSNTNRASFQESKNLNILNIIRYKWVCGVRLEAAGRLTRRYTAARSVFKFKYKGSLKNIDHSQKADITKKNMSTVMLRNYAKSNSQYSFSKSKRRIGAFGLKAWIASY